MGALLTFPGRPLPLVAPAKESAAAVLLPVSACRVVFVGGIPPLPEPAEPVPGDPVEGELDFCDEPHSMDAAAKTTSAAIANARECLRQSTGVSRSTSHSLPRSEEVTRGATFEAICDVVCTTRMRAASGPFAGIFQARSATPHRCSGAVHPLM